jgi:hypothetical protein
MTNMPHLGFMFTLPVMAGLVPAIPIRNSVVRHRIEITGTRPVMTIAAGGVR